jgi:hypothetical protein
LSARPVERLPEVTLGRRGGHPDRGNLVRTRLAAGGKRNRTPGPTVGARISIPALNFDAAIIADRSFSPRSGRLTARIRLCSATLLKSRRAI